MSDISPHFTGSNDAEYKITLRLVALAETPEAIREFTRCRHQLGDYHYWYLLGVLWVGYTGWSNLDLWKRLFDADRPLKHGSLMKPSEVLAFVQLPERFIVYRAHRPKETDWIAYTLNAQIAAQRFAAQRGVKEISAYEVHKRDVTALFLRRGEEEVIVTDKTKVRHIQTVPIVYAPSASIECRFPPLPEASEEFTERFSLDA